MEPTKPGWKTSEFYFMLAAQVLTFLFAAGVIAEASPLYKVLALVGGLLTSLGYAVVRGGVKKQALAASVLPALNAAKEGTEPDPT